MINNLYIDDQTARSQFGVWITRGGYSGLLAFPALKEPEANDWPEEDGVEVDLSDPKLERKEITLSLLADTNTAATDLVAYLSDPGYHRFRIPSLGREWRLRLAEHPENHVYPLQTAFSLKILGVSAEILGLFPATPYACRKAATFWTTCPSRTMAW